MTFALRLVPGSPRVDEVVDDDPPTTGVHRVESLLGGSASASSSEAAPLFALLESVAPSDEDRIDDLCDTHRRRVEALRCELALAARFLAAIAAGDVNRARAIDSELERAAPGKTCPPRDLGCHGSTEIGPCSAEEEFELDFAEVRALEVGLREALGETVQVGRVAPKVT